MKILFKKKIISLIILLLIIMIPLTISIIIKIYVNFSLAKVYKNNYSINIIQPQKIKTIYSEGIRDPVILDKLIYDEKDFFKTLKYDYVLPMDKNKVEKLINDKFMAFHSSLNAKTLNNVSNNILENNNNYYAYFESEGEYYKLFLYDVNSCFLYIVTITF